MLRKWMFSICSFLFAANVFAFTEGKEYLVLPKEVKQQAVVQTFLDQDKGKVQVVEFFSYKCPGCFSLEGTFSAWAAAQPQNIVVRRVPVAFNPAWEPLAKTYYVLEELNVVERINPIIFNAVHKEGQRLESQEDIAKYLSKHGVSANDFNAAYEGFNVNRRWAQAQSLRTAMQVNSIPAVVVSGTYSTNLSMTHDSATFTKVLDYLCARGDSNL
ncbi:MAG: thiol:disulfide interchange protein DsbA/DsbL [Legionellales bacterium]